MCIYIYIYMYNNSIGYISCGSSLPLHVGAGPPPCPHNPHQQMWGNGCRPHPHTPVTNPEGLRPSLLDAGQAYGLPLPAQRTASAYCKRQH